MYLMLNDNLEIGKKIVKKDFSNNLFAKLNKDDLYYEKLKKTYSSSYSVSPTGDVECTLLDDFDYVLDLYENIYIVREEDEMLVVEKKLSCNEYADLALNLIISSSKYRDNLYNVAEILDRKVVGEDLLESILDKIKLITSELKGDEYGFLYLFQTLNKVIPETYTDKRSYMECMCETLMKNIEILGLITDEEKSFLENCLERYYEKEYDNNIFKKITVPDLPF